MSSVLTRTHSILGLLVLVSLACQLAVCQQESSSAAQPDQALIAEGSQIFHDRCAKCHGDKGQGISAIITTAGPSLQAEHDHGTVELRVWVGKGMMPAFGEILTPHQIDAVVAYVTHDIAVIPLGGGDIGEGGELFRRHCAPCHRTAVRGGALAYTGVNAPALTDVSPYLVAGAIRWGPGPMPAFPSSVIDDRQLDSIVKYVQFVQHPPAPGGTPMNWYGPVAEGFVAWIIVFGIVGITVWIERGGKG